MSPAIKKLYTTAQTMMSRPQTAESSFVEDISDLQISDLRIYIIDQVSAASCNEQASLVITSTVVFCTVLANDINNFCSSNMASHRTVALAELEIQLITFLHFLQVHFPHLFDDAQLIPQSSHKGLQTQVRKHEKALREGLTRNCADQKLVTLILSELMLQVAPAASLSWRQYNWLQRCLLRLERFAAPRNMYNVKINLIKWLVLNGFNKPSFVHHLVLLLKEQAVRKEDIREQLYFWQRINVRFQQLSKSAAPSFFPGLENFTQLLQHHIQDEQHTLRTSLTKSPSTQPQYQLTTGLTVAQLAMLLRLLLETGVIKHQNQTELIHLVAVLFKTDRATAISPDSLRIKYYSTDHATRNVVKGYLIKMANCLR